MWKCEASDTSEPSENSETGGTNEPCDNSVASENSETIKPLLFRFYLPLKTIYGALVGNKLGMATRQYFPTCIYAHQHILAICGIICISRIHMA